MAFLQTFLVMAAIAVTSAWHSRSAFPWKARNVRDAPTAGAAICTRERLEWVYMQCAYDAQEPPLVHTVVGVTVSAEKIKAIVGEYCSITVPDKLRCMRNWLETNGCVNVQKIMDEAERTGGLCNGTKAANWLKEGLLDRMVDLTEGCFDREALTTCYADNPERRLDDIIDCLQTEIESPCDQLAVFTIHLIRLLLYGAQLGSAPSMDKLLSLKDIY